jgi:hypothetical protein
MGQVETKVFHSVPACQNTALSQEMVQMCWQKWRRDSRSAFREFTESFKIVVLLGLRMGRLIILFVFSWAGRLVKDMEEKDRLK